jgi:hypothetical protein
MATEKFKCQRWQTGQECKRYYTSPFALRAVITAFGVCVALATPVLTFWKALSIAPPAPYT